MSNSVKFVYAQSEKFNALENKDSNTLYFLEDTRQIYKGDILFSNETQSVFLYESSLDDSKLPKGTIITYPDIPDMKISDGILSVKNLPFFSNTFGITKEDDELSFSGRLNHKLIFGDNEIVYDGSEDVRVPTYKSDYEIF